MTAPMSDRYSDPSTKATDLNEYVLKKYKGGSSRLLSYQQEALDKVATKLGLGSLTQRFKDLEKQAQEDFMHRQRRHLELMEADKQRLKRREQELEEWEEQLRAATSEPEEAPPPAYDFVNPEEEKNDDLSTSAHLPGGWSGSGHSEPQDQPGDWAHPTFLVPPPEYLNERDT